MGPQLQQPDLQTRPQLDQPQQQTPTPRLFNEPFVNPLGPPPAATAPLPETTPPATSKKLLLVLGALAGVELLLVIGLGLALAFTPNTQTKAKAADSSSSSQAGVPQPATATGLQQTNDSITQDIGNLINERDFPATQLDDKSLDL